MTSFYFEELCGYSFCHTITFSLIIVLPKLDNVSALLKGTDFISKI